MRSLREFRVLLKSFLSGSIAPDKKGLIEKWYEGLDADHNHPMLDPNKADAMHLEDFGTIQNRIKNRNGKTVFLWSSLSAAAAVVLGISYAFYVSRNTPSDVNVPILSEAKIVLFPRDRFYNDYSYAKAIWLTDSSRIVLQPKSLITVAESFNESDRNVVLEGEAFFEIKRNEKKPFHVFTYGVVTQVLGTSFVIKAPSDKEQITVAVRTGKVSVLSKVNSSTNVNATNQVVLTPNQQATFYPDRKLLETSLVEKPLPLISPDKVRNEYDEELISTILSDLEKLYGVEISYDREVLKKCRVTTAFTREGLYQRMNLLTKAIGATYSVDGIRIVVSSKGCQL